MSIVARMQLATAVIEQYNFESVGNVRVDEKGAEISLHENAEFYKVSTNFKEFPIEGNEIVETRMEVVVNGVTLVAYRLKGEMSVAS